MKQLTKEQHEAIVNFFDKFDSNLFIQFEGHRFVSLNSVKLSFAEAFPPACCDSCADGHTCESDKHEEKE